MSTHTLTIRKKCLYPSELYLIQSDMQTDMCMHIHKKKNAWATCSAGLPNYYQLLCINKPWHKSSDESATPNTLETLPRLAHRRRTGQIGRRGRWRGQGRAKDRKKRTQRRERERERRGWQMIKGKGELGEREVWEGQDKSFKADRQQHLWLEALGLAFTA